MLHDPKKLPEDQWVGKIAVEQGYSFRFGSARGVITRVSKGRVYFNSDWMGKVKERFINRHSLVALMDSKNDYAVIDEFKVWQVKKERELSVEIGNRADELLGRSPVVSP